MKALTYSVKNKKINNFLPLKIANIFILILNKIIVYKSFDSF